MAAIIDHWLINAAHLFHSTEASQPIGDHLTSLCQGVLSPVCDRAGFAFAVFLPNMRKKDESLSRYPCFAGYRERSGLLLPRLLG